MITKLFKHLGAYLMNENDLSDVTCSMCQTCPQFRDLFVHFFFPELDVSRIENIRREVPDENGKHSRVDLMIDLCDDKSPYLIEVKIYDRQHHFGQYEEAYCVGKERLGYITNFICTEGLKLGYDVKTWRDWYQTLDSYSNQMKESEEKKLCQAYLAYLKEVCGFTDVIQSLSPSPETIAELMKVIRVGLENCYEEFDLRITKSLLQLNIYTFFFKNKDGEDLGGWIGVHDADTLPVICIGFQSNLNKSKPVYDSIKRCGLSENEMFSSTSIIQIFSGKCVIIPMSDLMHEQFVKSNSAAKQIAIVTNYIKAVISKATLPS